MERRKLPDQRASVTHTERLGPFDLYVTVGFYEDGSLGEVFVKISKHGSDISGLLSMLAMTISVALQHGVPWPVLEKKYRLVRFGEQNTAYTSVVDALRTVINKLTNYTPPDEDGAAGVFAPLLPFNPPQPPETAKKEQPHGQPDYPASRPQGTGQPAELATAASSQH